MLGKKHNLSFLIKHFFFTILPDYVHAPLHVVDTTINDAHELT